MQRLSTLPTPLLNTCLVHGAQRLHFSVSSSQMIDSVLLFVQVNCLLPVFCMPCFAHLFYAREFGIWRSLFVSIFSYHCCCCDIVEWNDDSIVSK